MTAIKAELRNYKPMVSQPYMQIILQVPSEQAQEAIKALGYPMPGESIWVGVARIHDEVATQNIAATECAVRSDDDLPEYLRRE